MTVTEEEAKTKRCQESFAAASHISPNGMTISVSAGMSMPAATAPSYCIGSSCMAWRFQTGSLQERMEKLGYCGKAGA